jgi:cell division protein FtsX
MAREIKNNPPGIRSFVFLTPEEALKEFGGSFGFVGSISKAPEKPLQELLPSTGSKKKTPKSGQKAN